MLPDKTQQPRENQAWTVSYVMLFAALASVALSLRLDWRHTGLHCLGPIWASTLAQFRRAAATLCPCADIVFQERVNQTYQERRNVLLVRHANFITFKVTPIVGLSVALMSARSLWWRAEPLCPLQAADYVGFIVPLQTIIAFGTTFPTLRLVSMSTVWRLLYVALLCRGLYGSVAPFVLVHSRLLVLGSNFCFRLWHALTTTCDHLFLVIAHGLAILSMGLGLLWVRRRKEDVASALGIEFLICFVLSVSSLARDRMLRYEILREMKLSVLEEQQMALTRNLTNMCDAVVYLHQDLRIAAQGEQLHRLLLWTRSFQCTAFLPTDFRTFIFSDEDEDQFRSFLGLSEIGGGPGSIVMSLSDCNGAEVPVRIFHSTCASMDAKHVHILGICRRSRERSRAKVVAGVTVPLATSLSAAEVVAKAARSSCTSRLLSQSALRRKLTHISEECVAEIRGPRPCASLATSEAKEDALKVWMRLTDTTFEMVAMTAAFANLAGAAAALAPASFTDLVLAQDREDFITQWQRLVNDLINDAVISTEVQLTLDTATYGHVRITAIAELDFSLDPEFAQEDIMVLDILASERIPPRRRLRGGDVSAGAFAPRGVLVVPCENVPAIVEELGASQS
eukprot:CAMPEP_0178371354 /NCGR_PEP_ID=MMETSP0689_2-20121128/782_1 /TAXON_ID=160604 /ORGANISM="Amphidinium massartii, Strain CS-259" /LENGTH=623 /DNA_ID=CAMNT_0019991219 /DNA_START=78 /DNA_END=1949 /DNA_ORIENTATION=+